MAVRRTRAERIAFLLNLFMVLAYALGGIALYFWKFPSIPDQNRKIASGILLLYAAYRTFRLFSKKKL